MQEINWLNEIFLTTGIWGLFGPMIVIILGYFLAKESKLLAIFWWIMEILIASQYFDLVAETPAYWWNILFLILGGFFLCIFGAVGKRR